jgi:hypothetical protein
MRAERGDATDNEEPDDEDDDVDDTGKVASVYLAPFTTKFSVSTGGGDAVVVVTEAAPLGPSLSPGVAGSDENRPVEGCGEEMEGGRAANPALPGVVQDVDDCPTRRFRWPVRGTRIGGKEEGGATKNAAVAGGRN